MYTQIWSIAHHMRGLQQSARNASWQRGLMILCVLLFAGSLYWEVRTPRSGLLSYDFYSYYTAAFDVRNSIDPFASVAAWIHSYQLGQPFVASYYVYAPFFALLVTPFTFVPFRPAFLLWSLCNGVMLYSSIVFLVRAAGARLSRVHVLLLALCASLLSVVRLEYNWGQADIFILFFICAAFYARQRERTTGAALLLAVACVTKPPLLLFVPFLLWKREFRFAITTTLAFLLMLFAPFLWLGRQAFQNQFLIWQFWSNQYISFIDNNSPKGVLARLFTINPNTHPIIVAPAIMTVLWLVVAVLVIVFAAAVIQPQPLQRDTRSLLEIGLVITAMFLISPLTEYIYLTLLIVPLCSVYLLAFVSDASHTRRAPRALRLGVVIGWLCICLPLQRIEYFFWPRMHAPSPLAHLYVLLAAVYLYVAVALFVLQLAALSSVLDTPFGMSVRRFVTLSYLLARKQVESSTAIMFNRVRLHWQQSPRHTVEQVPVGGAGQALIPPVPAEPYAVCRAPAPCATVDDGRARGYVS